MTEMKDAVFTHAALETIDKHFADERRALLLTLARRSAGIVDRSDVLALIDSGPTPRDKLLVIPDLKMAAEDAYKSTDARRPSYRRRASYLIASMLTGSIGLFTLGLIAIVFLQIPDGPLSGMSADLRAGILTGAFLYVLFGGVIAVFAYYQRRRLDRQEERWRQSGELMVQWLDIELQVRRLAHFAGLQDAENLPVGSLLRRLNKVGLLEGSLDLEISEILHIRNRVAHGDEVSMPELYDAGRAAAVVEQRISNLADARNGR